MQGHAIGVGGCTARNGVCLSLARPVLFFVLFARDLHTQHKTMHVKHTHILISFAFLTIPTHRHTRHRVPCPRNVPTAFGELLSAALPLPQTRRTQAPNMSSGTTQQQCAMLLHKHLLLLFLALVAARFVFVVCGVSALFISLSRPSPFSIGLAQRSQGRAHWQTTQHRHLFCVPIEVWNYVRPCVVARIPFCSLFSHPRPASFASAHSALLALPPTDNHFPTLSLKSRQNQLSL